MAMGMVGVWLGYGTTHLAHFNAVVSDAPSALSPPRSAAGQAQLRLGKPLRNATGQAPTLSGAQEEYAEYNSGRPANGYSSGFRFPLHLARRTFLARRRAALPSLPRAPREKEEQEKEED